MTFWPWTQHLLMHFGNDYSLESTRLNWWNIISCDTLYWHVFVPQVDSNEGVETWRSREVGGAKWILSFVFFLINLEFWVLLLGLSEQCHEALCMRNNHSSFCKLLATNSLQTQTSNSQRAASCLKPVPRACSALCWQKAGLTHPGLSADQRSSVWRWKFFLSSMLVQQSIIKKN